MGLPILQNPIYYDERTEILLLDVRENDFGSENFRSSEKKKTSLRIIHSYEIIS